MNKKYVYGFALALIVASSVSVGHLVGAAQNGAKKPLTLVDANGVFMGNIIGVTSAYSSGAITYTTYLPDTGAILGFTASPTLFFNGILDKVIFDQPDCLGNKYTAPGDGGHPWTNPWVVKGPDGIYYKISTTTENITGQSIFNGNCTNTTGDYYGVNKLIPTTLPFNPDTLAIPIKII